MPVKKKLDNLSRLQKIDVKLYFISKIINLRKLLENFVFNYPELITSYSELKGPCYQKYLKLGKFFELYSELN